jgi:protoporphyrinogen/coproporphyrinogen III oxidase
MAKHIVVTGGGIAGTSAAHWLVTQGYRVTIVEKDDRLGGRIRSHLVQGTAVEMGAGFMTKGYTNLWAFLAETGLDKRLYRQHSNSGLFRNGRITMISPSALAGSRLLSWGARLHVLPLLIKTLLAWPSLDIHASWRAARYDTRSMADMYSGKSGKEFLEYALQPLLNSYFYWTPEHTSQATLLMLCKSVFSHGVYKMQGGLQRIPEQAAEGSTILLAHTVKKVQQSKASFFVHVEHSGNTTALKADGVICATMATAVPKIFPDLTGPQKQFFNAIKYSSGALVARTYELEQTLADKAIAFPRNEDTGLAAVTLSSEPGVSGKPTLATIKTYASGANAKPFGKLSDDALAEKLISEMGLAQAAVLLNSPTPAALHVQRWPEALPFFDVGHFKRLEQFEKGGIEDPEHALTFAGDYIGGPYMEGAFTSGQRAAERLHNRLQND